MTGKLALKIYKEYYIAIKAYFCILKSEKKSYYKEYIKSFFTELETSDIPDWARFLFVKTTFNYPLNDLDATYWANKAMMEEHSGEKVKEKWRKDQNEGLKKVMKVMSLAEARTKNKKIGELYEDEAKYENFVELLDRNGGLFVNRSLSDIEEDFIKANAYYVSQGRLYADQKEKLAESFYGISKVKKL